jgi:hypothetical protein
MTSLTLPPLLIRIVASSSGSQKAYADSLHEAFSGNIGSPTTYVNTALGLPVPVQRYVDISSLGSALNHAMHTLVIVLMDESWEETDLQNLQIYSQEIQNAYPHHGLMTVRISGSPLQGESSLDSPNHHLWWMDLQSVDKEASLNDSNAIMDRYHWGEQAERPVWLALSALGHARRLLQVGIFGTQSKPRMTVFLSHAKKDGLPLARALENLLSRKSIFHIWYDIKNLYSPNAPMDWRKEIISGVESSTVVVLRTKTYENRPWCRKEFLVARDCGVPMVMVELRNDLERAPDMLTHDAAPTLWLSDGNLFRVAFAVMRENIRRLLLERFCHEYAQQPLQPNEPVSILTYTPTPNRISMAVNSNSQSQLILYPDPPLQENALIAIQAIAPNHTLRTPQQIIIESLTEPNENESS